MRVLKIFCVAVILSTLVAACSSSERRANRSQVDANKSQTELNERKMKIVDEYEKCVDKSDGEEDLAKCEAKLKAAEGL